MTGWALLHDDAPPADDRGDELCVESADRRPRAVLAQALARLAGSHWTLASRAAVVPGRGSRLPGHTARCGRHRPRRQRETTMAGMIRKLVISGIATRVIQEARKPQNQAKIKKAISDFQQKRGGGSGTRRTY